MSISDTDRDERFSALDQFAATAPPEGRSVIPQQAFSVGGDRIVGAQQVAVHRDEARVLSKLRALAAAAGDDWYYRFPVKNRKTNSTDYIEAAASSWPTISPASMATATSTPASPISGTAG